MLQPYAKIGFFSLIKRPYVKDEHENHPIWNNWKLLGKKGQMKFRDKIDRKKSLWKIWGLLKTISIFFSIKKRPHDVLH